MQTKIKSLFYLDHSNFISDSSLSDKYEHAINYPDVIKMRDEPCAFVKKKNNNIVSV